MTVTLPYMNMGLLWEDKPFLPYDHFPRGDSATRFSCKHGIEFLGSVPSFEAGQLDAEILSPRYNTYSAVFCSPFGMAPLPNSRVAVQTEGRLGYLLGLFGPTVIGRTLAKRPYLIRASISPTRQQRKKKRKQSLCTPSYKSSTYSERHTHPFPAYRAITETMQ